MCACRGGVSAVLHTLLEKSLPFSPEDPLTMTCYDILIKNYEVKKINKYETYNLMTCLQ